MKHLHESASLKWTEIFQWYCEHTVIIWDRDTLVNTFVVFGKILEHGSKAIEKRNFQMNSEKKKNLLKLGIQQSIEKLIGWRLSDLSCNRHVNDYIVAAITFSEFSVDSSKTKFQIPTRNVRNQDNNGGDHRFE